MSDFNVTFKHEEPRQWGTTLLLVVLYFGVLVPQVGWWVAIGIFICCWLVNWLQHIAQEEGSTSEEEV